MPHTIELTWDVFKGTLVFGRSAGNFLKRAETSVTLQVTMLNDGAAYTSIATAIATLKPVNAYTNTLASWTLSQVSTTNVLSGSATLDSQEIVDLLGDISEKRNCVLDLDASGVKTATIAIPLHNAVTRDSDGTPTPYSSLITASGYRMHTGKLLGRTTSGTGAIEEITVGTGLTLAAGTLTGTASVDIATQAEAEAGTDNTKVMTPLRTAQAIAAQVGVRAWAHKTGNYSAVHADRLLCNTSSAAFTITLPASPSSGNEVTIADARLTWATYNLTVARNSSKIEGLSENLICDQDGGVVRLVYVDSTTGWKLL